MVKYYVVYSCCKAGSSRRLMVGLTLVSELIFEAVKFVVMLGLLVLAVFAGGKIRKGLDAKKAAKQEEE